MSRIYNCTDPESRELGIRAAAEAVATGNLVVLPTDTLYGIGCDAFNNQAVANLLAAKQRGPNMPVPVLIGSWHTVQGLVQYHSPVLSKLVEAFWPGALSIIVPQAASLSWNLGDTRGTVLLRMPLHPVALDLLAKTGPLAVSSANISGQPPANTVVQAQEQLNEVVSVYLDGGDCPLGQPSSIIDISTGAPKLLREGAISAERIGEVLGVPAESLR